MMKKILTLSAAIAISTTSAAGEISNQEVVISNGTSAYGVLSAARHSTDNAQFIGCSLHDDQFGNWALCAAIDAAGDSVWCETNNPTKLQTIASLNSDSQLSFTTNENQECDSISVGANSVYIR